MHFTLRASSSLSPLRSSQSPSSFKFINTQSTPSFASVLIRSAAQRLLQLKVLQFRANLHSEIFVGLFTWMCAIYGLVVVALLCSCTNLVLSFSWRNQILHPLNSTNLMRKSYCILRVTKPFRFSSRESIPKAYTYHKVRLFSRFLIFSFVHVLDPIKMWVLGYIPKFVFSQVMIFLRLF